MRAETSVATPPGASGASDQSPQSEVDGLLDTELAERRERYKWLDGRYGWSTAGCLGILYFMFVNAQPMSSFFRFNEWVIVYMVTWCLGALLAIVALVRVGTGMLAFVLWNQGTRKRLGCTSLLWDDNILDFKGADDFVADVTALSPQRIRDAKAQEIWRLAFLNRGRERDLMWSRMFTVALGIDAVLYALVVLIVSGHLKFTFG